MQFERLFGHARRIVWKGPQTPLSIAAQHPIAAGLSSAATYILTSFALAAAGMYPEITWPVLAELNLLSPKGDSPPREPTVNNPQATGE